MFFIYVIESLGDGTWYIGFSTDVERRLEEHNRKIGGAYSKNKKGSWRLIYVEGYVEKLDALGREKFLKSGAGRRFLRKQLIHYIENVSSN